MPKSIPLSGPAAAERLARLDELLAATDTSGRWLVLAHDNPDPDAITAAALLARLLRRRYRRRVTIGYGGIIGRAENREVVKNLGEKISHLRHLSWKNYRHFALVDAQPRSGNHQLPDEQIADLVFDHHPIRPATQTARLADVRPEAGATVTLLVEYLDAAGIALSQKLATAVVYALRSETQEFGREYTARDKALYDRLLPEIDRRALARIQNARLPVSYFRTLHEALENLEGVDSLVVCHLGAVDVPDLVPQIADLLLRMEGKTWSFCTGVHEQRLYLSIRTTNPRAEAGALMRRLIGRRGKGGGHGMMAGGWIGLDRAPKNDPRALQRLLGRRLAKHLRKRPDRLLPLGFGDPIA